METVSQKEISPATRKLLTTSAYYAAFIVLGLTAASLGPTLPGLAEHTRSNLSEISFLFTARSLGYLLGSLWGGRSYDRAPGHRMMFLVLLLMVATLVLVPLLPLLWLLLAVLLVLGMAEGTLDVGGNVLLVWVHREGVGPFMNGLHFFFGVGAFLSPVIIAQAVLLSGDITWGYWTLALLILPVAVWIARLPSPKVPAVRVDGKDGQSDAILVILIALFFFLVVGVEASFGGWIYTYARRLNLGSETGAALLTSAFWGALTLGRLASIPIAAFIRPRWILLVDVLGCIASVGIFLIWPGSSMIAWVGTLGAGLFMASVFPTTITLAGRHMHLNGQVTRWFFVGSSAGSMFFPWIIGQLFERLGPQITMLIQLVSLSLGFVVWAIMIARLPPVSSVQDLAKTESKE